MNCTSVVNCALAEIVTVRMLSFAGHAVLCAIFVKVKRKPTHSSEVCPNRVKPCLHKQSDFAVAPLQAPVQTPITVRAPEFSGQVLQNVVPVRGWYKFSPQKLQTVLPRPSA